VHSTRPAMLSVRTLGVQFYTDSVESMGAGSFVPSRYGKATGPTRNRPPGATLQSRGSPIRRRVMLAVNPMSAVYPVHLQREIDRRWFHRSGTAPVRAARLKTLTDFFGVASVTPRLPTGASRLEVLQDSPRNIGSCSASASRMERGWHA
jgi:hypothetical protein